MKTRVLLFATLLAGGVSLHAQNGNVGIGTTTPSSKLTVNGNAAVGSGYTGTAAPADGAIIQGKVGVGIATPGTNLQVIGGIAGGTAFGVTGTAPVDNIYLELTGNTTLPAPNANGQILFVKNNTTGNVTLSKGYTGGLYDAYGNVDLASMTIVPIGHKMFIGFVVPGFTGWIAQLSQDPSMMHDSVWNVRGNVGTNSGSNFVGTRDNASLSLRTNNVQRMYVDSASGNVGIGTNAPSTKMHVSGNTPQLYSTIENTTTGQSGLILKNTAGNYFQFTDGNGDLQTYDGVANAIRLSLLKANGNLGLNTVAPTAKLDVNGTTRLRSTPTQPGTVNISPTYVDASGNVSKALYGDGDLRFATSSIINPGANSQVLAGFSDGIYEATILVGDGCSDVSICDFWVVLGPYTALMGKDGMLASSGVAQPAFNETATTSAVSWTGKAACQDGTNSTGFNYTVGVTNGSPHNLYIINNGNTPKGYYVKLRKIGMF